MKKAGRKANSQYAEICLGAYLYLTYNTITKIKVSNDFSTIICFGRSPKRTIMAPPPTLQAILIELISPQAVLFTYNQPKISNAFTLQAYIDMREALIWARDEPNIKVIVQ